MIGKVAQPESNLGERSPFVLAWSGTVLTELTGLILEKILDFKKWLKGAKNFDFGDHNKVA
ncbi:MAG: hypothetical protein BroJett011_42350 [Chloroflexota bacterium]|nr:MAG: hypothetical protein BroJett011_42350 [Chloroflexota bacterium]